MGRGLGRGEPVTGAGERAISQLLRNLVELPPSVPLSLAEHEGGFPLPGGEAGGAGVELGGPLLQGLGVLEGGGQAGEHLWGSGADEGYDHSCSPDCHPDRGREDFVGVKESRRVEACTTGPTEEVRGQRNKPSEIEARVKNTTIV